MKCTKLLKRGQIYQQRSPQRKIDNFREPLCNKCESPDHFIKFCPLWALEYNKNNLDKTKEGKGDRYVPNNRRMTNQEANLSMKKALAVMGGMSKDESVDEKENQSLLAVEQEGKYDFLALIATTETQNTDNNCQAQNALYD